MFISILNTALYISANGDSIVSQKDIESSLRLYSMWCFIKQAYSTTRHDYRLLATSHWHQWKQTQISDQQDTVQMT